MIGAVAQAVAVVVGVWLMFAPAVLGYGGAPADNDRIVGPVAASIALIAIFEVVRGIRLVNLVSGAWLVASALLLGYPAAGAVSAVASGAALIALSIPGGERKNRYGGGWRAVFTGATEADRRGRR
ncbi:MAG TPA: hypothetical protein VHL78_03705 [Actinomycetota bacterium]|nr:hypothetical protein [Actinomycetota bacterium]